MKTAPGKSVSKQSLQLAALLCALPATQAFADLTKADNTTSLQTAGAYVENTAPTTSHILVFNSTLANNGTFSAGSVNAKGLRVVNPASDILINQSNGSTFTLTNADAGHVTIDLSSSTRSLTLAGNATLRVKGASSGGTIGNTTFSIGSGSTLTIQSKLVYNNQNTVDNSTIHLTGAGTFAVSGTNGVIADKTPGSAVTAISLDNTWAGVATFSNANTYGGGTTVTGGTLNAANSAALGIGSATVDGGTLSLNGSSTVDLTFSANQDFNFSAGFVEFDLGTGSDQISGSGTGKFNLGGGTFVLTPGVGFSYAATYQLFDGFDSGTSVVGEGLVFTGFDTDAYQAILNTAGQLSFVPTAIPEPSSFAVLAGGLALVACAARRRSVRGA